MPVLSLCLELSGLLAKKKRIPWNAVSGCLPIVTKQSQTRKLEKFMSTKFTLLTLIPRKYHCFCWYIYIYKYIYIYIYIYI